MVVPFGDLIIFASDHHKLSGSAPKAKKKKSQENFSIENNRE